VNTNTLPRIQVIIPEQDLQHAVDSELSAYLVTNSTLDEYIDSSNHEDVALVVCHYSVLQDDHASTITKMKAVSPKVRVLVIGPSCESTEQVALLKHGARGYFDSTTSLSNLKEAIHCILHGEVWIERHVISGLIDELSQQPEVSENQRQAVSSLSPKELEVAELVSHGATNKMIAQNMAITERTVKAHLTAIFHKVDLADRLSLAMLFRDLRE